MPLYLFLFLLLSSYSFAQENCLPCHKRETEAFARTRMGRSIGLPSPQSASFRHQASASLLSVTSRDGKIIHSLERNGLKAEHPVAFAIGSGKVGQSYAVRLGAALYESPISWFSQAARWDLSPGFEQRRSLDFDRRITMECLYCHTGGMRKVDDPPHSITCERCHAPDGEHFSNPSKLAAAGRDSVCEQCHLQGEVRVLHSNSGWDAAAPRYTTYVASDAARELKVVSQVEQLALSKCAQNSLGKLWCGSCHSPHGPAKDQRAVCLTCHSATLPVAHAAKKGDCSGCHMPRRLTPEIAHTSYTDHRIRREVKTEPAHDSGPKMLTAWREPPESERDRSLGLAQIYLGERNQSVSLIQQGFSTLLPLKTKDADVLSALGTVLLQKQRPSDAAAMFLKAAELESRNPIHAQNAGVALVSAGNARGAVRELERAIELDPFLEQAYSLLADFYGQRGQTGERAKVLARLLSVMPQNLKYRSSDAMIPRTAEEWKLLGMSYAAGGDFQRADEPFERSCKLAARTGDGCYYYGRNLYSLNRFEDSLAVLKLALSIDARPWRVHLGIAMAMDGVGRTPEAEPEFKAAVQGNRGAPKALRLRPDEDPRIDYGVFLSRTGRTEPALIPLRDAAKDLPQSARARYELGRVLYQLGQLEDAEGELRAALQINPENATARRMLSKTLFRLNRTTEAEQELKRAEAQRSVTVK